MTPPVDPRTLVITVPPAPTAGVDATSLIAPLNTAPKDWQSHYQTPSYIGKPPVPDSEDLRRVLALPRRAPPDADELGPAYVGWAMQNFARPRAPTCACKAVLHRHGLRDRPCITDLRFVQAWALHEIMKEGGLLGIIGVGHGKTILDLLAPLAFPHRPPGFKALLLCPAQDTQQIIWTYELLAQHFHVPTLVVHGSPDYRAESSSGVVLHVLSYTRLSRPAATAFLSWLKPHAIIADEMDKLRDLSTTTAGRFLRCFAERPETRFAGWTGSMTNESPKEYAPHAELALRERSPLPREPDVTDDWDEALGPHKVPRPAGALLALCAPGEHVREGFRRRLAETSGVVTTTEAAVDCALEITERPAPPIPQIVDDALRAVRATWTRPDGEELIEVLEVHRCLRELACGFFYRWKYPKGTPTDLIDRWFDARKSWRRSVRDMLREPVEHMDSPHLLERAAMRAWGDAKPEPGLPEWKAPAWPAWRDVKALVKPESEAIRLHPYLAEDAAAWGLANKGVVWYEAAAFGAWIAEISGLPLHGGGAKAPMALAREDGSRSIVASMKAHGRGRDGLQRIFCDQLIAMPPANATGWEQLLGRLLRDGQLAAVIRAFVYLHTPELKSFIAKATARAEYVQATVGSKQKLLAGLK